MRRDMVGTLNDSHVMTLSDGSELGWLEYGDEDGWPVIGFHGAPGSRLQFGFDEPAVLRAGVRLIAPDRPGYGLSTLQPDRRLLDWPNDVGELANHLGVERFSVVGVSGGGPHAAVCAARLDERVVAAGIVSGIGPLSDPRVAAAQTRPKKLLAALSLRRSRLLTRFFAAEIALARRWPEKALDLMIRQLPPADAEVLQRPELRDLFERDVQKASRTTGRAQTQDFRVFASDWGFDLGEISIPVNLWQGDADRNVQPHDAEVMHEAIPNARFHWFKGEGHFLVIDRLEEILVALRP